MSAPVLVDAMSEGRVALAFLYPPGVEPERPRVIVEFMVKEAVLSDPELELVLQGLVATGQMTMNDARRTRREREAGRYAYPRWPR